MFLLLNLLLIFFGIGLFRLSYSLFRKSEEDKEDLKTYSASSYGGAVLIIGGAGQIIGYYISYPWWYSPVTLIYLEVAVYFLIRPGFHKSSQGAWKRKNILKIIFDVVIVLGVILLACDLFRLRFSSIQNELAGLSFSLGDIGEMWVSDTSRKARNIYIVLLIIVVAFIVIDLVWFV